MAQLDLSLDRDSDIPLGTQLAWKLRAAIATGALRAGDRLPGVRELAETAGVNVNTARAVYARLAEQGAIVSEHGRGTFVTPAAADADLRGVARRAADDARRLGVDPRELAVLLYADTAPPKPPGVDARQALRSEIADLERALAELDAELGQLGGPTAPPRTARTGARGPRLLGVVDLEKVRDRLSEQVADRRVRLATAIEEERAAAEPSAAPSPWPELFFSRRPATG
jgi:GntR family transcriptional regulator